MDVKAISEEVKEYLKKGRPLFYPLESHTICGICGKKFARISAHLVKIHGISLKKNITITQQGADIINKMLIERFGKNTAIIKVGKNGQILKRTRFSFHSKI